MKKLRWLKSYQGSVVGEEFNAGEKSAGNFVSQGFAVYVEEEKIIPPKETKVIPKKEEIVEDKFNAKEQIEKLCEEHKIFFTGKGEITHESLIGVGLGNLLYSKLIELIRNKPLNGYYIVEVKDPDTKQRYNIEIKYEGGIDNRIISPVITSYNNKLDLAEQIYLVQPYFFDRSGLWWLWNNKEKKWVIIDETEILIMVSGSSNANTISSKERNEILEAMKQFGRRKIPQPIKATWIQFIDKIYDITDGSNFEATPEYFVTNPIPWKVSGDPRTPTMDRIFEEWVGKENVPLLYEIIAYCILVDYPINRLFCFIGRGLNGKSKFLELLQKFVGILNVCSTELDCLIASRFEVTRLHKKLVCVMGETNFDEISKTSILKKLTGGDLIGFEYKNKTPFEDKNYAKILISTNNLPATTDKTTGFYRRWLIVDFPNTFTEKKDILKDIPEEEYNNLASNSIIILNQLIQKREFTNEGTVEERAERYEAKSNFLEKFIKVSTIEDLNGYITKSDFIKKFTSWCKENRHREMSETSIGIKMKALGYESSVKHFDWMFDGKGGNAKVWLGVRWKN